MLASVVADGRIAPPEHWVDIVRLALRVLRRWAPEAADVTDMADTLDRMYWEVCRRKVINPLEIKG